MDEYSREALVFKGSLKRQLRSLTTVSSSYYLNTVRLPANIPSTSWVSFDLNRIPKAPPSVIRGPSSRAAPAVMMKKLRLRIEWVPQGGQLWQNCFSKFRFVIAWRNRPHPGGATPFISPFMAETVASLDGLPPPTAYDQIFDENNCTFDGKDNHRMFYPIFEKIWEPYKSADHTPEISSSYPAWVSDEPSDLQPYGRPVDPNVYDQATGFVMQGYGQVATANVLKYPTEPNPPVPGEEPINTTDGFEVALNQLNTGFPETVMVTGGPEYYQRTGWPQNDLVGVSGGGISANPVQRVVATVAGIAGPGTDTYPAGFISNVQGGFCDKIGRFGLATAPRTPTTSPPDPNPAGDYNHGWNGEIGGVVGATFNNVDGVVVQNGVIGGVTAAGSIGVGTMRRPFQVTREPFPAFLPTFGQTLPTHDSKARRVAENFSQVWNTRRFTPHCDIDLDLPDEIVSIYNDKWNPATNSYNNNGLAPNSVPIVNYLQIWITCDSLYGAAGGTEPQLSLRLSSWFQEVYDC